MDESIKNIKELCKYFNKPVYDIYKKLLKMSNKYSIKVMNQSEDGEIYISSEYFDKIVNFLNDNMKLIPDMNTIREKASETIPFKKDEYIYFLLNNNELIYIGQTVNMSMRISTHLSSKEFNRVYYFTISEDQKSLVESLCINEYKPIHNITNKDNDIILEHVLDSIIYFL